MAAQFYAGTITSGTGTGNVTVTGIPFQPKAVLFFSTVPTSIGNAWASTSNAMIGVLTDAIGQFAFANRFNNNDNSPNGGRRKSVSACLAIVDATPTALVTGAATGITSDGFTINFTTNSLSTRDYSYLAIGGTGVSVFAGEEITSPVSTGNLAVTGVGFQPDLVILGCQPVVTSGNQSGGNQPVSGPMVGWYAGAAGQGVATMNAANNTNPTRTYRYQSTSNCLATLADTDGGAMLALASGVSLDADGFTLNWSITPGSGNRVFYLALKGVTVASGSLTQPTSTGNQNVNVGLHPAAALVVSSQQTTLDSQGENCGTFSIGVFDGTRTRGMTFAIKDNVNPSVNVEYSSNASVLTFVDNAAINGGSTTTAAQASLSFNGNNLAFNWGTADATQRLALYLAFKDNTGGGAGKGTGGGKKGGGGGLNVIQPGGTLLWNIGNPGLDIGST